MDFFLNDVHTLKNENGFCKIDEHMFDKDVLIIEENRHQR